MYTLSFWGEETLECKPHWLFDKFRKPLNPSYSSVQTISVKIRIATLSLIIFLSIGCADSKRQDGYIIQQRSQIALNEWDDVIDVFGFLDDEPVSKEITDYLNRTGTARYRYIKKD